MRIVKFRQMKDGTREDYALLSDMPITTGEAAMAASDSARIPGSRGARSSVSDGTRPRSTRISRPCR